MSRSAALIRLILLYLFVSSVVLVVWISYERAPRGLTIAFLDVGQGDAIYIESPTGKQVLIDGGINRDVVSALGSVMPLFDRSLDVVIATHPDKDHIGGLPAVFARYDVAHILDPGIEAEGSAYDAYADAIKNEMGVLHREARRGDVIDLGGGAELHVLFPDRDMDGVGDDNNASVITRLVYGQTEVLLTGDAYESIEGYLVMLDGTALSSDILKVGHHGSKTSSSEAFIAAVAPRYAIVSAACDNPYGHPHGEVIATLAAASTTILSTCEEGTIVFVSDGTSFSLR